MNELELLVVLLILTIAGCVSALSSQGHLRYITFENVRDNPTVFDGKTVNIRGYIQVDVLGSTSLYANADDAVRNRMYDAIDILSKDRKLRKAIKYKNPTCVIAGGKFRTYKAGEFKFNLPSRIGVIDLESVSTC